MPLASALAGDELVPPVQRSGAAVLQVKAGPCGVPAREAQVSAVVARVAAGGWLSGPALPHRGVSDMQRKMAETSKSLVLVREQLKLLRKK